MRKYTENQALITSVRANEVEEIKRILIDNIFFLQGNLTEINKAIEYAINQSDFNFEDHQVLEVSDKNDKENYFIDEKWNMDKNFSRNRYNLLVELYKDTFAKQEYTYKKETTSKKDEIIKKVVVGSVIIIAGYLIYKSIS